VGESRRGSHPAALVRSYLRTVVSKKMIAWVSRLFIGEDVFLSYARADGTSYVLELATLLSTAGFVVYVDQLEPWPSSEIPARVRRPLLRSSMLVVVGTTRAYTSPHVTEEIRSFLTRNRGRARSVGVVRLDRGLETAGWFPLVDGLSILDDVDRTQPSPDIVVRIERAATFTRLKRRQLRLSLAALTFLMIAACATGVVLWFLFSQTAQSRGEASRAASAAEASRTAARDAEKMRDQAIRDADQAGLEARRSQQEIDKGKVVLAALSAAKTTAEKQSESRRLAELSSTQLQTDPELAALLGIASLRVSHSNEGTGALRRALGTLVPKRTFDGTDLCFSGDDEYIYFLVDWRKVVEVETRTWRRSVHNFEEHIEGLVCSPSSNDALVVSGIEIWHISRGLRSKVSHTLAAPTVRGLGIAPEGTSALVLERGALHIFRLPPGRTSVTLPSSYVSAALISDTEVIAIGEAGEVFLVPFNAPSDAIVIGDGAEWIERVSPDGKLFVTRDRKRSGYALWSVERQKRLGPTSFDADYHYMGGVHDEFCTLESSLSKEMHFRWDCQPTSGTTVLAFPGTVAERAALTSDASSIQVWDPVTGARLARLDASPGSTSIPGHSGRFVAFNYGILAGTENPTWRYEMWDVFPQGPGHTMKYPAVAASAIALDARLSDDGSRAVVWVETGLDERSLQSWTLPQSGPPKVEEASTLDMDSHDLCDLAFRLGGGGGVDEEQAALLRQRLPSRMGCLNVARAGGGIAISAGETGIHYTSPGGNERFFGGLPDGPGMRSLAFSPDARVLAVSNLEVTSLVDVTVVKDGQDLVENRTMRTVPGTRVAFDPAGLRLAAYVRDGPLIVMESGNHSWMDARVTFSMPVSSFCSDIVWRRDGRFFITVHSDGIRVWDAIRGSEVWTLLGQSLRTAAFVGSSRRIVSFWQDGLRYDDCYPCQEPAGLIREATKRVTRGFTPAERLAFAIR